MNEEPKEEKKYLTAKEAGELIKNIAETLILIKVGIDAVLDILRKLSVTSSSGEETASS